MDRTLEFSKLLSEKRTGIIPEQKKPPPPPPSNGINPKDDAQSRRAFHQITLDVSKGINETAQSLSKLTKLVRQQGLFDDPTEEINKLIYRIKQELNDLNCKLDSAQQNVDERKKYLGERNQMSAHSMNIVSQLKSGLMNATKEFKSALEIRSSKMKDTQTRKSQITGFGNALSPMRQFGGGGGGSLMQGSADKKVGGMLPTPYNQVALQPGGAMAGQSADSRGGVMTVQSPMQIQQQQQQLLLAPPASMQYYESREVAVNEVEKTIGELGTLFKRLGAMLAEQQELVERIDEDVESAVSSADKAHAALLKSYESVSSNRALYTKIISILVLFIIFFVIFLM